MARASLGKSEQTLETVLETLNEEKAEDVAKISLAGKSEMADVILA